MIQAEVAVLPFLERRATRIAFMVALFGAALAARLPWLMLIPRFEDEGLDLLLALDVARGHALPLTGVDIFTGPLHGYLVAGMFRLFGENLLWPRLLGALFGALTVPAIFQLGRIVANNVVGVLAASLALTSPVLVVVGSHSGWPSSLTPFLAAVTLSAVHVGVIRRRPTALALGGFLGALTLQTNPLAVVLLAGIAVWYLATCPPREWLRRRELFLGVSAFAAGYAPMLWTIDARWTEVVQAVAGRMHIFQTVASVGEYFVRLPQMIRMLFGMIAGTAELVGALALVAVVAAGLTLGGSRRFVLSAVLIPAALLPLVTRSFYPRHLLFLAPATFVCIALAFARLQRRIHRGWLIGALVLIVLAGLGVIALYGRALVRDGTSNAAFFELRETLAQHQACQDGVLMEDIDALEIVGDDRTWPYFNYQTIRSILTLDSCLLAVAPAARLVEVVKDRSSSLWLIVPEQSVAQLSTEVGFRRVSAINPGPPAPDRLQLVLLQVGMPK